jgi:DNA polymerase I-like protein with 3'-5' exonuclease and polymerase domains
MINLSKEDERKIRQLYEQEFKSGRIYIKSGHDWYKQKASELFNVPYEEVTKDQRKEAKEKLWMFNYIRTFRD